MPPPSLHASGRLDKSFTQWHQPAIPEVDGHPASARSLLAVLSHILQCPPPPCCRVCSSMKSSFLSTLLSTANPPGGWELSLSDVHYHVKNIYTAIPSIVILFEHWHISFSLSGDSLRFSGINESFEDWGGLLQCPH